MMNSQNTKQNALSSVRRILVVDDSPETRYIYRRFLQRGNEHYIVEEADTVAAGLDLLRHDDYDCVLLDFCLPDGDGLDLLIALDEFGLQTPVVMITGQGSEPVAVEAMKRGAKDYLVKDCIDQGRLVAAVEYAMDEARTEREQTTYRKELEHKSVTDPLTGAYNRRYLFSQLDHELQRTGRYGTPLTVLMLDLDHFKSLNDTHGHLTGDRVLELFAGMLQHLARNTDIVARYGGEEFCVVLTNTDIDGGMSLAERVVSECRKLDVCDEKGQQLQVTCSAGVAEAVGQISSARLIEQADKALYQAKHLGRNRHEMFRALETESA